MIRLDRVELLHWDIQAHQALPLAGGVTLITGENGSGKTSILDAIKVGLGAASPGGDRSVEGYLLKQARAVAMIRLLVDNRPIPGTRRRPFDPLGEHSQDIVTLAVVFRAEDESTYRREYYILDGDVVPIETEPGRSKPGDRRRDGIRALPSRSEYRERLKRVGITPRYLTLLTLPQGQIANLCKRDGAGLFDDIFDIIGGRYALEAWEERLRELGERQREQKRTETDLAHARRDLELLERRVREHHDYLRESARFTTYETALPYVRIREVQFRLEELRASLEGQNVELRTWRHEIEALGTERDVAVTRRESLEDRLEAARERGRETQAQLQACTQELGAASQRMLSLEELREQAESVSPRPLDEVQETLDALNVRLADGTLAAQARAASRVRLEAELAELRRGILPHPPDVREFRGILRRAGVPHHVLADVLDVEDDAWRPAVEAWLGRYRFAILVQDAASWSLAVELAREHAYAHGILAPDVRGHSPADDESPVTIVRIKEARYRSLLARLLRAVRQSEPLPPYAPTPRHELLAEDGFVISRLEARVVKTDRFYLGREARERRQAELEAEILSLGALDEAWRVEERGLRAERQRQELELSAQRQRLKWEAARDDYAETSELVARLEERRGTLVTALEHVETTREAVQRGLAEVLEVITRATTQAERRQQEVAALEERITATKRDRERVEGQVGRLEAAPRDALGPEAQELLDSGRAVETVEETLRLASERLTGFEQDVRDLSLPTNFERQRREVASVEGRLDELGRDLAETLRAAEEARDQYHQSTRAVFRAYFARLREAAASLDYLVDGKLEPREDGRFRADVRIGIGSKALVHHDSQDLSGGQKAALSILMSMTAVSLESDGAGFFLIDEPFSASDVVKINELGRFLQRTGAQYLVSMPTSADVRECGDWLQAFWLCTRGQGGSEPDGTLRLAPPVILGYREGARDV